MKRFTQLVPVFLVLALVVSLSGGAAGAARTRDVCIASPTGGGSFNTFILRNVGPLSRGGVISLHGVFFTGARKIAPVHGTAAMGMDGSIVVGLFVHSTAQSTNDFTAAGLTDANFAGTLSFDNDGDFVPNGTLAMSQVDCAAISIP